MATELSNHFKHESADGKVDFINDSIKIVLMATAFTFDKDTHATYANVSASELTGGSGYTQNTKVLTTVATEEDDTNDRVNVTCDDVSWTASGGSIGPSPGAIIYDDTTSDDTVIGYIDFGSDQTATDGGTFNINNIIIRLT